MDKKRGKVLVVVGGQWGSEAKGLACQHFVKTEDIGAAVRTGAINAGHTVYDGAESFAMCQIPVAWINQKIKLVLGAGAYVEPEVFDKELKLIDSRHTYGVRTVDRVLVDQRAYLHAHEYADEEKGMHERMGSTAHGCGTVIKHKIDRKDTNNLYKNSQHCKDNVNKLFKIEDTTRILAEVLAKGETVLLEGTQGTLLDFHYGESYPYVTSRQTIAAAWLAEAGLPPKNVEVVSVMRTFPIRVAGNSGPMQNEISWWALMEEMNTRRYKKGMEPIVDPAAVEVLKNAEIDLANKLFGGVLPYDMSAAQREKYATQLSTFHSTIVTELDPAVLKELRRVMEMTTVTKKVRRIARMSDDLLNYSCRLNGPDAIFLNFVNYKFAETWGMTSWSQMDADTRTEVFKYLNNIEKVTGCPVKWVSTAANTVLEVPSHRL